MPNERRFWSAATYASALAIAAPIRARLEECDRWLGDQGWQSVYAELHGWTEPPVLEVLARRPPSMMTARGVLPQVSREPGSALASLADFLLGWAAPVPAGSDVILSVSVEALGQAAPEGPARRLSLRIAKKAGGSYEVSLSIENRDRRDRTPLRSLELVPLLETLGLPVVRDDSDGEVRWRHAGKADVRVWERDTTGVAFTVAEELVRPLLDSTGRALAQRGLRVTSAHWFIRADSIFAPMGPAVYAAFAQSPPPAERYDATFRFSIADIAEVDTLRECCQDKQDRFASYLAEILGPGYVDLHAHIETTAAGHRLELRVRWTDPWMSPDRLVAEYAKAWGIELEFPGEMDM